MHKRQENLDVASVRAHTQSTDESMESLDARLSCLGGKELL